MIIVRPMGGMGNQMYAYALGRALSLRLRQPLYIDRSWLDEFGARKGMDLFALSHFQLDCPVWPVSRRPVLKPFFHSRLDRVFSFMSDRQAESNKSILMEKACRYDSWINDLQGKHVYIRSGAWQSYKYFADCADTVRRDFVFRDTVYADNRDLADQIRGQTESVSVHIRRGDYVNNADCAYTQGICTRAYYDRAIAFFRDRLVNPRFYFFSDDIGFVRQEFGQQDGFVFVDRRASRANEVGYRDDGHNDMFLMSQCRNNIIANSTFSWWAAFLNSSEGKQVVAPAKWYQGVEDDSFIIPPGWIRIDPQGNDGQ